MNKHKKIEVFQKKPDEFLIEAHVSGACIIIDRKVLLLQSAEHKEYANQWGLPAGKLEREESAETALLREVFEETKISLCNLPSSIDFYIRKSNLSYIFHLFKFHFSTFPEVTLSDEHIAFAWVPLEHVHTLPLIEGAPEIFSLLE